VARFLISAGNLDPSRFVVMGRGEFEPAATNTDANHGPSTGASKSSSRAPSPTREGEAGMNKHSWIAIILFTGIFLAGFTLQGNAALFINGAALVIVVCGTMGAMFLCYPAGDLRAAMRVTRNSTATLRRPRGGHQHLLELALHSRGKGVLALESVSGQSTISFLKRGMGLVIDGISNEELAEILHAEMFNFKQRRAQFERMFRQVRCSRRRSRGGQRGGTDRTCSRESQPGRDPEDHPDRADRAALRNRARQLGVLPDRREHPRQNAEGASHPEADRRRRGGHPQRAEPAAPRDQAPNRS